MSEKKPKTEISRREFLKMMGAGLTAGLVNSVRAPARQAGKLSSWLGQSAGDPQVEFGGRLLRGSLDGCIYASVDGGATWELLTRLHPQCAVTALKSTRSGLVAALEFQGHRFLLASTDGRVWKNT